MHKIAENCRQCKDFPFVFSCFLSLSNQASIQPTTGKAEGPNQSWLDRWVFTVVSHKLGQAFYHNVWFDCRQMPLLVCHSSHFDWRNGSGPILLLNCYMHPMNIAFVSSSFFALKVLSGKPNVTVGNLWFRLSVGAVLVWFMSLFPKKSTKFQPQPYHDGTNCHRFSWLLSNGNVFNDRLTSWQLLCHFLPSLYKGITKSRFYRH